MRVKFFHAPVSALALIVFLAGHLVGGVTLADDSRPVGGETRLRIATFNVSLFGKAGGEVKARLAGGEDPQALALAAIVQAVSPDILVINEIDHDVDAATAKLLAEKYFAVGRDGSQPVVYTSIYSAPSNTGVDSSFDLDGNGKTGDPADAWGYGVYPGQYATAVMSRYPIDTASIRTFQKFLWADLPGALRPRFPDGREFYDDAVWGSLRLSSKNHVDVPVKIGERTLHVLASHPTPPVFDGPEDRNGCRNHDEIQFWIHYLGGSDALVDDDGNRGGIEPGGSFVVMGDLNSDPVAGDSRHEAIRRLLTDASLTDSRPVRLPYAASNRELWKRPDDFQKENPATATADFGRNGLLRVDYVLPSKDLVLHDAKVFWPGERDPRSEWTKASDHHLVWIDVVMP